MRFEEVPGSRGRMSNYHSLVRANDVADAIIYCVSAGHNSYNYYGTLAENINGGLSTMDRINGMYDVKGKKSASAPTTEKKEKTKSAKLSFAVVTMIDQPERSVVDRSAINVEDVLVYETSAVTGEGVQSTLLGIQKKKKKKKKIIFIILKRKILFFPLSDIIQQAIERTEKGKKLSREAGVTLAQLQEDKKKRVELDQAQHSSVKASGLLSKFTSFFKGAVRAPAVAVEAKTITPTNAVADLAVSA